MPTKHDIRKHTKNQMEQEVPSWNQLPKKEKKAILQRITKSVLSAYNDKTLQELCHEERLNLKPFPLSIVKREEILKEIEKQEGTKSKKRVKLSANLEGEKRRIREQLSDEIIEKLLAPSKYTADKRKKKIEVYFWAMALKMLYYPDMSYRKFCELEINDRDNKTNRAFIGLPLNGKVTLYHTELSRFRHQITLEQSLNMMFYVATEFMESGIVPDYLYGIDASDIAAKVGRPLHTIEMTIGGKHEKISFFGDIDAAIGKRRKKRDKSENYIGYKMHAICAIDLTKLVAYPLLNVLIPANHHDSQMLKPLLELGKAFGFELQVVLLDQGYDVADDNLREIEGTTVIAPGRSNVKTPPCVDTQGDHVKVYCHEFCETAMDYKGHEGNVHCFHCAGNEQCPFYEVCVKERSLPIDNGLFGPLPQTEFCEDKLSGIRRVIERPFNQIKHCTGTDTVTVKGQGAAQVEIAFSTCATLLRVLARKRKEDEDALLLREQAA